MCVSGRDGCRAGRDLLVLQMTYWGSFQDLRPRTSHLACCSSQRLHHAPIGSGALRPPEGSPLGSPEIGSGARGGPSDGTGAASGSTCLCWLEAGRAICAVRQRGSPVDHHGCDDSPPALVSFVRSAGDAVAPSMLVSRGAGGRVGHSDWGLGWLAGGGLAGWLPRALYGAS